MASQKKSSAIKKLPPVTPYKVTLNGKYDKVALDLITYLLKMLPNNHLMSTNVRHVENTLLDAFIEFQGANKEERN